jgi:hypothetical protein
MSAYSWVHLGDGDNRSIVSVVRAGWSKDIASVFSPADKVSSTLYQAKAGDLRSRLHLLGHVEATSTRVVESEWLSRTGRSDENDNVAPDALITDWVAHSHERGESIFPNSYSERLTSQWGYIWGREREQLHYLVCRIPEDVHITLDVSEPVTAGEAAASDTIPEDARAALMDEALGAMPTIVLTEGSTDAAALQAALKYVRPGYQGLMSFLDYSQKPTGGAGAVALGLKAFAAAGVGNRIVGLFDNDTAGQDAMSGLPQLPPRFVVRQLPPLEIADSYPTYGPNGLEKLDVNGRAVSIEFFFGADILMDDTGELSPVQWTSYISSRRNYQGELLEKKAIQNRFFEKVKRAEAGDVDPTQWIELGNLLDCIADW